MSVSMHVRIHFQGVGDHLLHPLSVSKCLSAQDAPCRMQQDPIRPHDAILSV